MSSWLFVPATRLELLPKAQAASPERVVIDLEDAISADAKSNARTDAIDAVRADPRLVIRINHPRTREGRADVVALEASGICPDYVIVPKVERASDIAGLAGRIAGQGVIPMVESAIALRNAGEIAAVEGVATLSWGMADLALAFRTTLNPLLTRQVRFVVAAAAFAAGCEAPLDAPDLDFKDLIALDASVREARAFGFASKLCIHPAQVSVVTSAFGASSDEIARAQRILEAESAGAVTAVDGVMIDKPVFDAARQTVARG